MSLVSAVKDQDRDELLNGSHPAGTVKKTTIRSSSSVYQTSGEPLSKEALYRAKLKYGVYQSPATKTSTGVSEPKVASDIAANLANDNKTTINAYKRLFVDPGAAKAATKVGVKGIQHVPANEVASTHAGSQSAATRAYSIASNTSAKKVTKTSGEGNRHRSHSVSSASHALTSSFSEKKVNPPPKPLNLAKVLSGAERQAEQRIHDRTTPERKNFSYGLKTNAAGKAAGNSFQLTKETLGKMASKIDSTAIEKEADPHNYAEWAAYAVRDIDPKTLMNLDFQEAEKKRQTYLSQLTSQQVLLKARENADRELKAIDALDHHNFLFGNEAYNKAAVERARKNAEKMVPYQNKINLGGGLWLSPEDVDDIAKGLINPVLGEVTQRAGDQRATDLDIKERNETYRREYAAWLDMQHSKLQNNQLIVAETDSRHAREKEATKAEATKTYNELVARKDKEIAEKNEKLAKTKESKAALEKQMEDRLKSEDERVKLMIANFTKSNEKDIKASKKEQEELLKPYHDGLKEAEDEHARLLKEKTSIEEEIEKLRTSIETHKEQLAKYEEDIKAQEEKETSERQRLTELGTEKDELRTDLDENVIVTANKAKEQAAISSEEARLRQLEVDAIINERKSKLNETEIELQREKLSMLDAMRKVAEARGDKKIDEERVKSLIGMTSEEYMTKQKELHGKDAPAPVGADLDEEDEPDEDLVDSNVSAKPVNRHLDLTDADDAAPSASVKSVTGASGRIPEETKPTENKPVKNKSLETKAAPPQKHVTVSDTAKSAKGDDEASWAEKFFLGGPSAKTRRESLSKAKKGEKSNKPATTKEGHDLEHTFSGFSQGSIEEHAQKKKTAASLADESEDDDEEVPELSGTEGNDESNGENKRSSYFQEVF